MVYYIINQERNNRPYTEIPLGDHVNKSNYCLGGESSRERKFQGTKVPGSESTREQKFLGTKVPPMELSLPGAKVHGNESSIIPIRYIPAAVYFTHCMVFTHT